MYAEKLMEIHDLLYDRFGPQQWWPGDGRFEIVVGAILTQNTNWLNVEKAIANLKAADCLDPAALADIETDELAQLIRPAGYYNIKAKRLKNFMQWLFEDRFSGDLAGHRLTIGGKPGKFGKNGGIQIDNREVSLLHHISCLS